ncbi:MAG TPA: leucyl aminopeptidase [Acidimicrobiales bacterium]|nr:leucyl aminopeptidase [Acidimicrobiales bacterium]
MSVALRWAATRSAETDLVVYFVTDGFVPVGGATVPDAVSAKRRGFNAESGETLIDDATGGVASLFIGLGETEKFTPEVLRRAGAAIARSAKRYVGVHISLEGLEFSGIERGLAAELLGIGIELANYQLDRFRSEPTPSTLEFVEFADADEPTITRAVSRAMAVGEAVSLARDLINTPAGDLAPSDFAEIAQETAKAAGLGIEVFDEERIAKERMGGLLGVAAGSVKPPRFITLTYEPEGKSGDVPTVALVGKGITFDSGGLSLKSGTGMMTMKMDMSGAAAVLSTLSVCARLGVKVRVVGYMPLTENMPSGTATKPGDVLRTRSGKTIEVLNTDAEGRLILADALTVAAEGKPDAIIDLATLTGACVIALGSQIAGLLGNDDALISQVQAAGRCAGEAIWPLPLPAGYHSHIESEIADMKNIGATGQAGTISAALLLEEFVGDVPWAHLDIAGPAWSEEDRGLVRKGGSGFGVRTLLALLENYQSCGGVRREDAEGITVLP